MQDFNGLFGLEFRKCRLEARLSQWDVALTIPYHIRNIQRIEKGLSQPGIGLSFALIHVLDVLPGDFLSSLADKYRDILPASVSPLDGIDFSFTFPASAGPVKSLFGPMLLQARVASSISQNAMATAAGYNLRNINTVEKGRQEPGVMTALALVLATGVDVREFFNSLYFYWHEHESLRSLSSSQSLKIEK